MNQINYIRLLSNNFSKIPKTDKEILDCLSFTKSEQKNVEKLEDLDKESIKLIIKYFQDKYDLINPNELLNFNILNIKKIHNFKETFLYSIGYQIHNNHNKPFYFIKFNNILMIDIDSESQEIEIIKNKLLLKYPNKLFYIYKTFKGFHVYCVSHFFDIKINKTFEFMKHMDCDNMYISFCYKLEGFSIRLYPKRKRKEKYVEKFICKIGFGKKEPNILNTIKLKDNLMKYTSGKTLKWICKFFI